MLSNRFYPIKAFGQIFWIKDYKGSPSIWCPHSNEHPFKLGVICNLIQGDQILKIDILDFITVGEKIVLAEAFPANVENNFNVSAFKVIEYWTLKKSSFNTLIDSKGNLTIIPMIQIKKNQYFLLSK